VKIGKFYKHRNCTDVVIMPIIIEEDKEKRLRDAGDRKLLVDWYNIARPEGTPIKMDIREQIRITDKEWANWEEYPRTTYGYTEKYVCSED
jgi:hypothetical protein